MPGRLVRHVLALDDGHRVGVAVAGRGVPLVVVHGFGVEGLLYAQPLGRLAALGFRVVAVDAAGHGATAGLGEQFDLTPSAELLGRTLDHLGIRRAVLAGHSMGGRLVAEVAADRPEQAIAVLLLDAIVGEPWDRLQARLRWLPPWFALFALAFAADAIATVPLVDPGQALKLGRRVARSVLLHATRPWRSMTPGLSVWWARPSVPVLEALGDHGVPVVAIHGDRDLVVPLDASRDAAARTGGELIVVRGATHSWMLRCPETFPSIVSELLGTTLGAACDRAVSEAGLDPVTASPAQVEVACCEPGAVLPQLGPDVPMLRPAADRRAPEYDWDWVPVESSGPLA
ncbi:MAG: alpha/beta hydrolase [Acidimicrobiia bacterium]|nr:alpha/beta hydrolase [Acidimicrobiia bacterium]